MRVKTYVGAITALAAVVGASAWLLVPDPTPAHRSEIGLLLVLVTLSEWLNVRYFHDDHAHAFNLMEGILAALAFIASGAVVVAVAVVGVGAANLMRRNSAVKSLFNVAQWTLAAGLGALVMHALRPAQLRDPMSMPVLLAVIVLIATVNFAAMSGVLKLATGSAVGSREHGLRKSMLVGQVVGNVASIVTGICLAATYVWSPMAMFIGLVVVLGMHASGRANASLRADGVRLAGLQRATHALATSLDAAAAYPQFVAATRLGFEVREVELVLFADGAATTHRCTGPADYSVTTGPHPLAEEIVRHLLDPARVDAIGGTRASRLLAATGHSRVLAVPLRASAATIGVLFLYDRIGMEGFESGELAIAEALGLEVVSFLERVALLHEVDDERRKLADILGATSDGIFSLESDGTISSWNAGLAAITGYDAEEIVGTRHFGLLRPRDGDGRDVLLERWLDRVETPGALPADLQIVTASGSSVWLSCSYSRIAANERGRDVLVVVARNVTQARELERLKDDFVAVVSHELRTPLVPIKGWAQTLLNRGDRLSDAQRRTAVQSIFSQAQKLESLVLNILEAARIEAAHAQTDGAADISEIVVRLVEESLAARPERAVRLQPPAVACAVRGSTVWVERAVSNLLANAIKYSPDDEPVDVVITAAEGDVVVAVTDRGPGIVADAQERIFDRFERLEETRTQAGTGLGLYITRRLARAMGGDVTVTSAPGSGSTFLLRLPRAAASARVPEQRPGNVVRLR